MARNLLGTVVIAAWCVLMASLIELGTIETKALSQPENPVGEFSHPMNVGGVIRYVTSKQERLDHFARIGSFGSVAAFVLGIYFFRRIKADKNSN